MADDIVELHKQYRGTYIRIKKKTDTEFIPILVVYFQYSEAKEPQLTFRELNSPHNKRADLKEIDILFDFPELGVIQVGKHPIYLSRSGVRQWLRGLCSSVLELYNPFEAEYNFLLTLDKENSSNTELSMWATATQFNLGTIVKYIYNPYYYEYYQGLEAVDRGDLLGAAFSRHFYIAMQLGKPNLLLGYKTGFVGYIDKEGTINLPKSSHHLYEELAELAPVDKI